MRLWYAEHEVGVVGELPVVARSLVERGGSTGRDFAAGIRVHCTCDKSDSRAYNLYLNQLWHNVAAVSAGWYVSPAFVFLRASAVVKECLGCPDANL